MASVSKLKLEYEIDFKIIGICSHAEDFKLCWHINNKLSWLLERTDNLPPEQHSESIDLFSIENVSEDAVGFTLFNYLDEDNFIENYLVSNFSSSGYLLPEFKQYNYFIILKGESANEFEIENVINLIDEIEVISSSYSIHISEIKDLHLLMF